MKKNVLIYGLIAGVIVSGLMAVNVSMCYNSGKFDSSIVIGYATMLIAFSMIFVGIKNYRDKYNGGVISFGKAFRFGLLITLIASTIYVGVWLIEEHYFFPDFMKKYAAHEIAKLQSSGLSPAELTKKTEDIQSDVETYNRPGMKILMAYAEILPVGILVSLISALILKRKGVRN